MFERIHSKLHSHPDGVLLHTVETVRDLFGDERRVWLPQPLRNVIHGPVPSRTRHFVGRDELIQTLSDHLEDPGMVALCGPPGIGKSRIAVEVAMKGRATYPIVWWLDGSSPESLSLGLIRLGIAARVVQRGTDASPTVPLSDDADQVRTWLEAQDSWLLVVDAAAPPAQITPLLPQGGNTIITTVHQNWCVLARTVEVSALGRDAAVSYLVSMSGDNDRESAEKVADHLGGLPLALAQAAAFTRDCLLGNRKPLKEYLDNFRQEEARLLERGEEIIDHPTTVVTSVAMMLQHLDNDSLSILRILAYYAPDAIPFEHIRKRTVTVDIPEPWAGIFGSLRYKEALGHLRRISLISRHPDGLLMHGLIQAVVRFLLDDPDAQYAAAACSFLNVAIVRETWEADSHEVNTLLMPHVLRICRDTNISVELGARVDLRIVAAQYGITQGWWRMVEQYLKRAEKDSAHLPEPYRTSAKLWCQMVRLDLSLKTDNIESARELANDAMEVIPKLISSDDDANAQSNTEIWSSSIIFSQLPIVISEVLFRANQREDALLILHQLESVFTQSDTPFAHMIMAKVHIIRCQQLRLYQPNRWLSDYQEQVELAEAHINALPDPSQELRAELWIALGKLYMAKHSPADALPHFQRALDIATETQRPDIGIFRQLLSTALCALGKIDDAIKELENALIELRKSYGHDRHHHISSTLHELGFALMKAERLSQAENRLREAASLGDLQHLPHLVIPTFIELSRCYHAQKQPKKALEVVDVALGLHESAGLEPSVSLARAFHAKAIALVDLKRIEDAIFYYHETLKIEEQIHGNHDQLDSATTQMMLAQAYAKHKRWGEAVRFANLAQKVLVRELDSDHRERQINEQTLRCCEQHNSETRDDRIKKHITKGKNKAQKKRTRKLQRKSRKRNR